MSEQASLGAEHLRAYLAEHGITGEVVKVPEPTPTVEAAARAVGTSPEQIVKSVLFLADGAPVLVIATGVEHIDNRRVAAHLGLSRKRLKLAGADVVQAVTGFPVGAVPPFGHRARLRTLIDPAVLDQAEVYAGGGDENALLRIAPAEIVRVTGAEPVPVAAEEKLDNRQGEAG